MKLERFSCYKTDTLTFYALLSKYWNLLKILVLMYSFTLKLLLLASFVCLFAYCLMYGVQKVVIKSLRMKRF